MELLPVVQDLGVVPQRCSLAVNLRQLGLGAFLGLLSRAHTKLTSDSLGDSDTPPSPVLSLYLLIPPSPTSIPGAFTLPQEPEKVAYIH